MTDVLHGADGDPRVHAAGAPSGRRSAICRRCASSGRWASRSTPKPGSGITRYIGGEPLPGRRHVVADGDGRDHDYAAARRDDAQARVGDASVSRNLRGDPQRERRESGGWRRPARVDAPVARRCCAASTAIPIVTSVNAGTSGAPTSTSPATARSATLTATSGCSDAWTMCINVAGHRIGTMEVESALVDHPAVAEAAVVGARARDQGAGDRRVRHAEGRAGAIAQSKQLIDELKRARRHEDRRDRAAGRYSLRGRSAEDAIGQDHAAPVARHRGRQGASATRRRWPIRRVVAKLKENYEDEYRS